MKLVLDTNIFINATHAPNSASGAIIKHVKTGDFTMIVSRNVIEEYNRELNRSYLRRFRKKNELTNPQTLNKLIEDAKKVRPDIDIYDSEDPSDNKFIECAVAANADYLVSSDSDLLDLRPYENVAIVSPNEFINKLEN